MPTVIGVILLVLVTVGAVIVLITWWLRARLRRMRAEWIARGLTFHKGPESASYQGHERSTIPVRGNGLIALTNVDLRFMQVMPRREFIVPLFQITGIEQHRMWKGRYTPGRPVLVVHYCHDDQADAIGLSVRDPQGWHDTLLSAAHLAPVQP